MLFRQLRALAFRDNSLDYSAFFLEHGGDCGNPSTTFLMAATRGDSRGRFDPRDLGTIDRGAQDPELRRGAHAEKFGADGPASVTDLSGMPGGTPADIAEIAAAKSGFAPPL